MKTLKKFTTTLQLKKKSLYSLFQALGERVGNFARGLFSLGGGNLRRIDFDSWK